MGKLINLFTYKLGETVSATLVNAAHKHPSNQVRDVMKILGCEPPIDILRESGDMTDEEAIKLFIDKIKNNPKEELLEWRGSGLKPVDVISNIEQIYDFVRRDENQELLERALANAQGELTDLDKERQR